MALVTLESFESGAEGGALPDLIRTDEPVAGGTYSLNVIHLSGIGGPASAQFQHLSDPGIPAPDGVAGEWAGWSSSGWNLAGEHYPSDGLGFYLRLSVGFLGSDEAQGSTATITWASSSGTQGGQLRIEHLPDDTLEVTSLWFAGEDSANEGPFYIARDIAEWYQIEFTRTGGWFIKVAGGATLFSSDYPFSMPSAGLTWNHSIVLGGIPDMDDTEIDEAYVDQIYGYSGRLSVRPAVRMYPRDDGRGMSSAPRIFPPPKSGRIIGGHQ